MRKFKQWNSRMNDIIDDQRPESTYVHTVRTTDEIKRRLLLSLVPPHLLVAKYDR
jgi:hypothetical protein